MNILISVFLGEGSKAARAAPGAVSSEITKPNKAVKPSQKKIDSASVAPSEKKGPGAERPPEKERKKDVPHPRMQYDDESRVEKAKRKAVVKQTEARNRVELFRHLPQYEHGSQLPDLESKFFQLELMHPAVYKVVVFNFQSALLYMRTCLKNYRLAFSANITFVPKFWKLCCVHSNFKAIWYMTCYIVSGNQQGMLKRVFFHS